jgi:hypothetical protein
MQLKILNHDGQCRGRPPTKCANRDGPGTVGQFSVGSWQSVIWNLEFGTWNLELRNLGTLEPRNHGTRFARDWISLTCSVYSYIAQDRHKDRLKAPDRLAENRPHGRGMPDRERIFS